MPTTTARKKATKKAASAKKATATKKPAKKKASKNNGTLPKTVHVEENEGEWKDMTLGGFKKYLKDTTRLKAEEVDQMLNLIDKGQDFEPDPELDEKQSEFYSNAFAIVTEAVEASAERAKEIEEEKAELEAEKKKEHGALALAGCKGYAIGEALEENFADAMSAAIGDDYEVTPTSLHIRKGATLTEAGVAEALATLVNADGALDRMRGNVLWSTGDLLMITEESFPNHEEIIGAVVESTGKTKHTVMESLRLAKAYPEEERMADLTATHHQEINNYRKQIKPASKLKKIIKEVREGTTREVVTTDPETGEEKVITQTIPLSCGKLRKMLQEAAGKEPTGKDGAESEAEGGAEAAEVKAGIEGFFYFDILGQVFYSEKFDPEAWANCVICVDTVACATVDGEGNEENDVPTLNKKDDLFPAGAEAPDEEEEEEEQEVEEEEEEEAPPA